MDSEEEKILDEAINESAKAVGKAINDMIIEKCKNCKALTAQKAEFREFLEDIVMDSNSLFIADRILKKITAKIKELEK